jgi:hypothetical protein
MSNVQVTPCVGGPYDQRLARLLIRPFAHTALHPNAVTGVSLALGLTAACLFATDVERLAGWAALLFMLAVLTDHADGELARMTGKTSTLGHRLDYIAGTLNYAALFIGLGIGLSKASMSEQDLILGLTVGIANPVICVVRLAIDIRHGGEAVAHPGFGGFELEDFIYLIGPIAWLGGIEYFFLVYGMGTFGYLLFTIVDFIRIDFFSPRLAKPAKGDGALVIFAAPQQALYCPERPSGPIRCCRPLCVCHRGGIAAGAPICLLRNCPDRYSELRKTGDKPRRIRS